MFTCQACERAFKPEINHSNEHDVPSVTCPECNALHIAIHKDGFPGGPNILTFKIVSQKQ
jgi:Zn finger protein HypA/HybF involved in hydrogenase expression